MSNGLAVWTVTTQNRMHVTSAFSAKVFDERFLSNFSTLVVDIMKRLSSEPEGVIPVELSYPKNRSHAYLFYLIPLLVLFISWVIFF